MERTRSRRRGPGWLLLPLALLACGCQSVKTPEERIARSNLPRELTKTSLPDYVVEPPDLIAIEVLEALPGRPIGGERLVRPDGKISLGFYGDIYVAGLTTDEIKEKVIIHLRKFIPDATLGLVEEDENGQVKAIPPVDSDRVFVEVTSYNSKAYYVQGDVAQPGRLPITGNETVLDAINYAGGLLATAATQDIRLVRPAPAGACCQQVLPVNYAAIVNAGDTTTNYQLLPGDRLVIYRDPVERTGDLLSRLARPFQIVVGSVQSYAFAARAVKTIDAPLFAPAVPTTTR
ncbi:MAG TPA: polysaccharide biosynthesis/export family protein [Isosphaeraceae bacterium]|jgi:polysaccharide export outer membrane protein